MGCYIIASIIRKNVRGYETAGYKVLNSQTGQFKLLTENDIKRSNIKLVNAKFEFDILKGTQCDLKRYTRIFEETGKRIGDRRFVILGKDSNGYILYVPDTTARLDIIKRISPRELKDYCFREYLNTRNESPIANACVKGLKEGVNISITPIRVNTEGNVFDVIEQCPKYLEKEFHFGKKNLGRLADWKVRVIKPNEVWGPNYDMKNTSGKIMVELYDISRDKTAYPIGERVCNFYIDTFLGMNGRLSAISSQPNWQLSKECFDEIEEWLKTVKE